MITLSTYDPRYRAICASAGYRMLVKVRARIYRDSGLSPAWALIDDLLTRFRAGQYDVACDVGDKDNDSTDESVFHCPRRAEKPYI